MFCFVLTSFVCAKVPEIKPSAYVRAYHGAPVEQVGVVEVQQLVRGGADAPPDLCHIKKQLIKQLKNK